MPVATHSCTLSPPQPLDISAAEQHTLDRFKDILEVWGWHWEFPGACTIESAAAHGGARLTHAAVVLGTPLNGVELQVCFSHASLLAKAHQELQWMMWVLAQDRVCVVRRRVLLQSIAIYVCCADLSASAGEHWRLCQGASRSPARAGLQSLPLCHPVGVPSDRCATACLSCCACKMQETALVACPFVHVAAEWGCMMGQVWRRPGYRSV